MADAHADKLSRIQSTHNEEIAAVRTEIEASYAGLSDEASEAAVVARNAAIAEVTEKLNAEHEKRLSDLQAASKEAEASAVQAAIVAAEEDHVHALAEAEQVAADARAAAVESAREDSATAHELKLRELVSTHKEAMQAAVSDAVSRAEETMAGAHSDSVEKLKRSLEESSQQAKEKAIGDLTVRLNEEHEEALRMNAELSRIAEVTAVEKAIAIVKQDHTIALQEFEQSAAMKTQLALQNAKAEAENMLQQATTETNKLHSKKLQEIAVLNETAILEAISKEEANAEAKFRSEVQNLKQQAEEDKFRAISEALSEAESAHLSELDAANKAANEALIVMKSQLNMTIEESSASSQKFENCIAEERTLRLAAETMVEDSKIALEELRVKDALRIANAAKTRSEIETHEMEISNLQKELESVQNAWEKERQEAENADEPTLYRKVALMEKEMKQVHEDAATLAERGGRLERRCHEAETKAQQAEKRMKATEAKLQQYESSAESKQEIKVADSVYGKRALLSPKSLASSPTMNGAEAPSSLAMGYLSRSATPDKLARGRLSSGSSLSNDGNLLSPGGKGTASAKRQQKYQAAQAQIATLVDRNSELESRIIHMEEECKRLMSLNHQNSKVHGLLSAVNKGNFYESGDSGKEQTEVEALRQELLRREYESEVEKTKLQAHLLRVRGRVHVKVRIRPRNSEEQHQGYAMVSEAVGAAELAFMDPRAGRWRPFAFDAVHGPTASQSEVFRSDLRSMSSLVVDGYSSAIIAYGQTGSGKTHTMQGSGAEALNMEDLGTNGVGVNQRMLSSIFSIIKRRNANPLSEFVYTVELSMIEIYNESVVDLLSEDENPSQNRANSREMSGRPRGASKTPAQRLEVTTRSTNSGARVHVRGLTRKAIASPEEARELFQRGMKSRAVAATDVHAHSSRSHCIVRIDVRGDPRGQKTSESLISAEDSPQGGWKKNSSKKPVASEITHGRLYLVDLAGSERVNKSGVKGKRLIEAKNINRSLSALGDVIEALDKKRGHIPYRNSILTRILQDSLCARR